MSNVSYNELKEAFEKTEKLKEGYSEMSVLRPQPGDIVAAYFNWNEIDIEQAAEMHRCLTQIMPDKVSVITIPDASSLVVYGLKQFTTEMFYLIEHQIGRKEYIKALRDELDRVDGDDLK